MTKPLTIEKIKKYCSENNIVCLSDTYSGVRYSKITILCKECGEPFEVSFEGIKYRKKTRCNKCSKSKKNKNHKPTRWDINSVKRKCEEFGIELLSTEYKDAKKDLEFKCKCGNIYKRTWNKVCSRGSRYCEECTYKIRGEEQKVGIEAVKEFCEKNNLNCLSKEYQGDSGKLEIKCSCGEVYRTSWNKLRQGQVRCKKCSSKESFGEYRINCYLKSNKYFFKREARLEGCRRKNPLKFDFVIFDKYEIVGCIEFDGQQHYRPVNFNEHYTQDEICKRYEEQKERDIIKNNYCQENNIPLLRIPYWEVDNIDSILQEWLETL